MGVGQPVISLCRRMPGRKMCPGVRRFDNLAAGITLTYRSAPSMIRGMESLVKDYDAEILARVILPERPTMSREAAKEVLALSFSETDRARMTELAAKARAGALSAEEQAEIAGYERISSLLGFLKSKARLSLQSRPDA